MEITFEIRAKLKIEPSKKKKPAMPAKTARTFSDRINQIVNIWFR